MTVAAYEVRIDIDRNDSYTHSKADITDYVLNMQWQSGMAAAYDEVANPARLMLEMRNDGGEWNVDGLGANLITNGDFTTWSSGNPGSWTVTGESGSDPEVSQVGESMTHGGGGTGLANLYTTSAALSISQNVLTSGQRYYCTFRISALAGTGGVCIKSGTTRVSPIYHSIGMKSFSFFADSSSFVIATDGAADVTIDDVTVQLAPLYYQVLASQPLIRVRMTFGSTVTMFKGKVTDTKVTPGATNRKTVSVTCEDAMLLMLDTEYFPKLQTDVTVDQALDEIFDNAIIHWPYPHSYWMLGVDGASELGTTTILYNHTAADFETGITTLPFVGDNADSGEGVSLQGFIRDLVAAELGGRFYFDTRTNKFIFHNRHHDFDSEVSLFTLTEDEIDFDSSDYLYSADVMNRVTVNYNPRQLGTPGSILWQAENLPVKVGPGEIKEITGRFKDPDVPTARVGATDVIPPVVGTDFIANVRSKDVSNRVSMSYEIKANSIVFKIENTAARQIAITTLQVRGTPLLSYEKSVATAVDGDSARKYGWREGKPRNINMLADEELAQAYADYLLSKFKEPFARFASVTFSPNQSDALMTAALNRVIGDRITITDTSTNHNQDYIIVGERHKVTERQTHMTTWVLKPTVTEQYWKLGQAGYTELGETTRLAL